MDQIRSHNTRQGRRAPSPPPLHGPFYPAPDDVAPEAPMVLQEASPPPTSTEAATVVAAAAAAFQAAAAASQLHHTATASGGRSRRRHGARTGTPDRLYGVPPPDYTSDDQDFFLGEEEALGFNLGTESLANAPTISNTHMSPVPPPVVPPRAPVSNEDMFRVITEVLQQLSNRNAQPRVNHGQLPYYYYGTIEENPGWFLTKMEDFFTQYNIRDDTERILYVGEQLLSDARRWYASYIDFSMPYQTFRQAFIEHFDSPMQWARARARLYGTRQTATEDTEKFLIFKRKLFRRLEPYTSQAIIIQQLIDQLRPNIRYRMRGTQWVSIDAFIQAAIQVERDEQEERRYVQRERRPDFNTQRAPLPVPSNDAPPYACRHCGEWHYHRLCPRNPQRPLNEQRAEANNPPQGRPSAQQPLRSHPSPNRRNNNYQRPPRIGGNPNATSQ